jgi:hypothetical protein
MIPSWQTKLVARLIRWHKQAPSWGKLAPRLAFILLGLSVFFAAGVALDGGLQSPILPYCLGILTGLLATNLALIKQSIRNWRVLDAIIDWPRVEEMARDAERPGV